MIYLLQYCFFFFIIQIITDKIQNKDLNLFIKYFIIIFILKIILSSVTILPDPSSKCKDNINNNFKLFFYGGCYDLIFSIHMALCLLILSFLKKNNIINHQICILIAIIQATLIILTHNHYTVDVLLAFIVVPFVINGKYFI